MAVCMTKPWSEIKQGPAGSFWVPSSNIQGKTLKKQLETLVWSWAERADTVCWSRTIKRMLQTLCRVWKGHGELLGVHLCPCLWHRDIEMSKPFPLHLQVSSFQFVCPALSAAVSLASIPVSIIQSHCPHKFICTCQLMCDNFWLGQYEYLSHQLSLTHTFCYWFAHTSCFLQIIHNPWLSHWKDTYPADIPIFTRVPPPCNYLWKSPRAFRKTGLSNGRRKEVTKKTRWA